MSQYYVVKGLVNEYIVTSVVFKKNGETEINTAPIENAPTFWSGTREEADRIADEHCGVIRRCDD